MSKIAIVITTFMRNDLCLKSLKSVIAQKREVDEVLIIDQNNTDELGVTIKEQFEDVRYLKLPFDCGVSQARNEAVKYAQKLLCTHVLLMADSIILTEPIEKLSTCIDMFSCLKEKIGIIGLSTGTMPWEFNILRVNAEEGFVLDAVKKVELVWDNKNFKRCEVVGNFFIATIDCLLENTWDNNLKLLEHEDFFYRLKLQHNCKVLYTDYYSAIYESTRTSEYDIYRKRMYSEFKQILFKKYNIENWITYANRK